MLLVQTDKQSEPLFAWGDALMIYNGKRKYSSLDVQKEWYEHQ